MKGWIWLMGFVLLCGTAFSLKRRTLLPLPPYTRPADDVDVDVWKGKDRQRCKADVLHLFSTPRSMWTGVDIYAYKQNCPDGYWEIFRQNNNLPYEALP
jgi:hypothetical protein